MLLISTIILALICFSQALNLTTKILYEDNTDILGILTDPRHYDKRVLPYPEDKGPLEVKVRVYVYHLKALQAAQLDITVHILLELLWEDNRLKYDDKFPKMAEIKEGKKYLQNIWIPHIFFTNEKESFKADGISEYDYLSILPTGTVVLTTRIKASMMCLLQLLDFPFDQQKCQMSINSWSYSSEELRLVWDRNIPLQLENLKHGLEEFDILSVKNVSSLESVSLMNYHGKNFSSLGIIVQLRRHYEYYFVNYYLPSVLLVITSWVAFWYEPAAISTGRVTIGISTMFTFIILCWSGQEVQKGSQFMATDIWTLTCTAFIILSLIESAFVNTIDRKGKGEKVQIKKPSSKHIFRGGVDYAAGRARLRRSSSLPSLPEIRRQFAQTRNNAKTMFDFKDLSLSLDNLGTKRKQEKKRGSHLSVFTMTPQEIAKWIDLKCRIIFPAAFLIFNIIYWLPLIIVKA